MPFPHGVISKEAYKLESIYSAANEVLISKNTATKLLGRARLESLVDRGLIEMNKPSNHQHGRWQCNAADVLRYVE